MLPLEPEDYYTQEEVFAELAAITPRDRALFRVAAVKYARDTRLEPDDLVNEAILRTLAGERQWKRAIGIYWHLCKTMQSIQSFEHKHRRVVKKHQGMIVGTISRLGETLIKYGIIGSSQNDNLDPHEILGGKQELLKFLQSERLNALDI